MVHLPHWCAPHDVGVFPLYSYATARKFAPLANQLPVSSSNDCDIISWDIMSQLAQPPTQAPDIAPRFWLEIAHKAANQIMRCFNAKKFSCTSIRVGDANIPNM